MRKTLIIKGIQIFASNISEKGSGLKLKYWPFENGNVNTSTISIATISDTEEEIWKKIKKI